MARIEGEVGLQLTVDDATGEVSDVVAVSGNRLLQDNAVNAAKHWRFKPGSTASGKINATLDYSLRCR